MPSSKFISVYGFDMIRAYDSQDKISHPCGRTKIHYMIGVNGFQNKAPHLLTYHTGNTAYAIYARIAKGKNAVF